MDEECEDTMKIVFYATLVTVSVLGVFFLVITVS